MLEMEVQEQAFAKAPITKQRLRMWLDCFRHPPADRNVRKADRAYRPW
jgi:hypothetical protein